MLQPAALHVLPAAQTGGNLVGASAHAASASREDFSPGWEPKPFHFKIPHGIFLKEATSVAVDAEDRVYVFNRGNMRKCTKQFCLFDARSTSVFDELLVITALLVFDTEGISQSV